MPRGADEPMLDAAWWDAHASQYPPCERASSLPDSGWVAWSLQRPHATIRLPVGAREQPTKNPDVRHWALPDSAHFEVWITPDPAAGLAASGSGTVTLESECAIPVAKHAAVVVPYRIVGTSGQDTAYGAAVNTILERGLSLNVFLDARSLESRQQLLGAVAGLQLERTSR